jgi:hypothetical protein
MRTLIGLCALSLAAASLGACASDGGRYARYETPREACLRDKSNDRAAGTVVGAGVGALAGSAIAGNSSNTAGTVAGGVVGGVIGNQAAKGDPCYGY